MNGPWFRVDYENTTFIEDNYYCLTIRTFLFMNESEFSDKQK